MKLAFKFTITLLLGMVAVLGAEAYLTWRSELMFLAYDVNRDHRGIGTALKSAFLKIWKESGEEAALRFIGEVRSLTENVTVSWIWVDTTPAKEGLFALSPEKLALLAADKEVALPDEWQDELRELHSFFPVDVGGRKGAIVISVQLTVEKQKVRDSVYRIFLTIAVLTIVYGFLAIAYGIWFVGRPVGRLIRKARRVGSGDFSGHLELSQKDELAELAREVNAMCDRLAEANARLARETEARIATIEQLRHADRLMTVGKLASGVAHELGTPLNVVMARAKMLSPGDVKAEDVAKNARIIFDEAQQMTKIIRQLLDFARPRRPSKVSIDLNKLARQTLEMLAPMASKRQVTVVPPAGEEHVLCEADAAQIQQVLSNLVMNGIQSMPRGGKLTVEIRKEWIKPPPDHGGPEAEYLCLSVRDEGHGITEDDMKHIFEPFFTTKDVGEGTGLGLSVSLGIVREHGGWVGVTSQPEKGSCFSVYLPPGG